MDAKTIDAITQRASKLTGMDIDNTNTAIKEMAGIHQETIRELQLEEAISLKLDEIFALLEHITATLKPMPTNFV